MYEDIFNGAMVHFACTGCQSMSDADGDEPVAGRDANAWNDSISS